MGFVIQLEYFEEKFLELMLNTGELAADVGTVIDGKQAVELGLIYRLGGLSDALAGSTR